VPIFFYIVKVRPAAENRKHVSARPPGSRQPECDIQQLTDLLNAALHRRQGRVLCSSSVVLLMRKIYGNMNSTVLEIYQYMCSCWAAAALGQPTHPEDSCGGTECHLMTICWVPSGRLVI
jgi:hypothetical protein